jgi:tRNA-2-methylthio-N6-dimethylallyladenosine synthase
VSAADRLAASRVTALAENRIARSSTLSAWLPIVYGCDKTCTYCIVPFSRGPERSRPFDDIVAEARSIAAAGFAELTLLGQNVNSYGHDLPAEQRFAHIETERTAGRRLDLQSRPDLAELLRAIDGIRGADGRPAIPRLRFITSHPWDLSDRLIEAMAACESVAEHLHLPIQAGDDGMLQRMGRQYTLAHYQERLAHIREAVPGIAISTDVIVGFCGETDAEFGATLGALEEIRFDTVFAAAYSPRPGTSALRMADDVAPAVKRRRLNELLAIQEGIGLERNQEWLGREVEVLVERITPPRRGLVALADDDAEASDDGAAIAAGVPDLAGTAGEGSVALAGRTRHNKLVHFAGHPRLVGGAVTVRIDYAGPFALRGRVVATPMVATPIVQ